MEHKVVTDYTNVSLSNQNVKVFVRLRPPSDGREDAGMFRISGDKNRKVTIKDPKDTKYGEHAFAFDRCFDTDCKQEEVYDEICTDLIEHVFEGYNSCCFAYGQTGSGKTYSMFGEDGECRGIIPRTVEQVFRALDRVSATKEVAVVVSFLEMYCDQVRDLGRAYLSKDGGTAVRGKTSDWYMARLASNKGTFASGEFKSGDTDPYESQSLAIHEDAGGNVFVKGLSVIPVTTMEEVITVVQMGFRLRATHETKMNAVSSRSHTVFTIHIVQKDRASGETVAGMLNLVDLAGSERLHKSESEGQRLREALSINSSLSALGKVIMSLDPAMPSAYVPYRDSKLTRLLQNSVGGNSYTTMLACVHPRASDYDECLSTLQFANRCRNVRNQPRVNYVNEDGDGGKRRIRRLMEEISTLKRMVENNRLTMAKKVQRILAEVGVEGELLPDGRFRTRDGMMLGLTDAELLADRGDIAMPKLSAAQLARVTDYVTTGGGASVSQLQRALKQERHKVTELQARLKTFKSDHEALKLKVLQESEKVRLFVRQEREKTMGMQKTVVLKERDLDAEYTAKREEHKMQVKELLATNQAMVDKHTKIVQRVPEELKVKSEKLKQAYNEVNSVREQEEGKRHKMFMELNKSHKRELEIKAEEFQLYKDKMEAQHAKIAKDMLKGAQRLAEAERACKQDVMDLYGYTKALADILVGLEHGDYKIRQAEHGGKAFMIPSTVLPEDPLSIPEKMTFLRGLMLKEGEMAQPVMKGAQFRRKHAKARVEDPVRFARDRALESMTNLTRLRASLTKKRPSSAASRSTSTQLGDELRSRPSSARPPRSGGVGGGVGGGGGSSRRASRPEDDDTEELRHEVTMLRGLVDGGLEESIKAKVLADMVDHPTVSYIRKLEEKVNTYQKNAQADAKRVREMRVALNAQSRSMENLHQEKMELKKMLGRAKSTASAAALARTGGSVRTLMRSKSDMHQRRR